ncbi:hypothetical protein GCM10027589_46810 [Actinocorallia lasiicapitis]
MSSQVRRLAAVAAGGALGAVARYALTAVWPHPRTGFAWSTFTVNVTGCLVMGLAAAWLLRRPMARLFLGVGVLGGFTTFSTYVTDVQYADPMIALVSLAATPLADVAAVGAGQWLAGR